MNEIEFKVKRMRKQQRQDVFRQIVANKYLIYNSLFTALPYEKMSNIGMLIPFLYKESKEGYAQGKEPRQIIEEFFRDHTESMDEDEQIDLMFRIIQYIERQVVLFDSIEDVAFRSLHDKADFGTVHHLYQVAKENNKLDEVREKLKNFAVRVVFTAHPTQFYSNEVQRIMHEMRDAIRKDSVSRIDLLLQQLGLTPFITHKKPTPYDEALSIIYYLRHIYYDSLGSLFTEVKLLFGEDIASENSDMIQLGFWPGGDRDGNPFVKADTTWRVAQELNISILKCYYNHLKELRKKLTFRKVNDLVKEISQKLYKCIFQGEASVKQEELLNQLKEIRKILIKDYNSLYLNDLDELIDRVNLFGTHFASLDIRQDSSKHDLMIRAIFQKEFKVDYDSLEDEDKIKFLTEKSLNIQAEDYEDEIIKDTINNIKQLKEIQAINGEKGVHRYIISNSESVFDILNVYAFFKYCGYKDEDIKFDIIPLFETIKGFSNSEKVMNLLYNQKNYAAHLKRRNGKQTIMLGFSDGTKDGGYVRANWGIYETKEALSRVAKANGVKVVFFDGRGGPPARGGGKTHQFYESQGQDIANYEIQLTIQGQTITSVYGTKEQSYYNFEQLLTAGVNNEVFKNDKINLNENEREILNNLAQKSYQKYVELKENEKFVPYLEKMSTLKYYGKTNIGSRPSKRGSGNKLIFSDLRAIPFVGSWSLLKQNVPGYYGFGTAIQFYKENGKIEELKKLFKQSSFFKTLVENSMMSMMKTYFPLTQYMKDDIEFGEFWELLYNEFELTKQMILEVSGYKTLMEDEPVSKASVDMREKIVLPLLTIQQYALQKIQENNDKKEVYENMVMRCLFGNINASRNSA